MDYLSSEPAKIIKSSQPKHQTPPSIPIRAHAQSLLRRIFLRCPLRRSPAAPSPLAPPLPCCDERKKKRNQQKEKKKKRNREKSQRRNKEEKKTGKEKRKENKKVD
jgi:hypothetical protein